MPRVSTRSNPYQGICIPHLTLTRGYFTHYGNKRALKGLILLFGSLNCLTTLQHKLRSHYLSPNICPLCLANSEDLQHLLFDCSFSSCYWQKLLLSFNLHWVFSNTVQNNVLQIWVGPQLSSKAQLLWSNVVKALIF